MLLFPQKSTPNKSTSTKYPTFVRQHQKQPLNATLFRGTKGICTITAIRFGSNPHCSLANVRRRRRTHEINRRIVKAFNVMRNMKTHEIRESCVFFALVFIADLVGAPSL